MVQFHDKHCDSLLAVRVKVKSLGYDQQLWLEICLEFIRQILKLLLCGFSGMSRSNRSEKTYLPTML